MAAIPDDLDRGSAKATSLLEQRANEIKAQKPNWPSYLQSNMISEEDYQVLQSLESSNRDQLLLHQRPKVAQTLVSLLSHVSKEHTVQWLLVAVDAIISEDTSRVDMFRQHAQQQDENQWTVFLNLLTRPDHFTTHITARVIAKLACWGDRLSGSDLTFYLTWLKDQLKAQGNEYIQSVCRCLQMVLRDQYYREVFHEMDGVPSIVQVLSSGQHNFQIQYQLTFCLWVLTFSTPIATSMNKVGVVGALGDVLQQSVKEKVTRITLAVLRNLVEKPDQAVARDNCLQMVQCKVLKQLEILAQKKFEDEDITADIEFLNERLQTSIQDLSSFEEYCSEVRSGRMEWSPVHKSEKFWRENCHRLNENNYQLLRILISLMESSSEALVLAVACHDIGQYARHYPRGKKVLEQLEGKQSVMAHLSHAEPSVRYEALLAVQKLMVHNWEYLGKQVEKTATPVA